MRKILYNRALFILHKNVKPSHFHDVIRKEVFDSHSKENHFVASKMLNFLIIVLFTQKLKILVLSYSTLIRRHFTSCARWVGLTTYHAQLCCIPLEGKNRIRA